jgi:hypothetical protein
VSAERLSGNRIDALGRRLRDSPEPSQDDLQLLQELLAEHVETLDQVHLALRGLGLQPHPRLKSTDTIIEKLRRERHTLRQIHDLAGTRVVKRMSLSTQDELVRSISNACPGAQEPIDRRVTPNHGYRAVHVICRVDGRSVEIQVRTLYQDTWAQLMEKMGDWYGRQIRYGEAPLDPSASVGEGTRQELFDSLQLMSLQIALLESAEEGGVWQEDHPVRKFLYNMRATLELPEVD